MVQYLFETNGKQIQGIPKRRSEIQTLIAHLYSSADRNRLEKNRKTRVMPLETMMKDDIMDLLLYQVLVRGIEQDFRHANYDKFSTMGATALKSNLFWIQHKDVKSKFETAAGKDHRNFRNRLLLTTLRALQIDSLNAFPKSDSQIEKSVDVARPVVNMDENFNEESSPSGSGVPRNHRVQHF